MGSYYYAMPCQKITGVMASFRMPTQLVLALYPACESYLNGTNLDQHAVVPADFTGGPEQAAALLDITFGMSIWMAFVLHAVGIEVYVSDGEECSQMLRMMFLTYPTAPSHTSRIRSSPPSFIRETS